MRQHRDARRLDLICAQQFNAAPLHLDEVADDAADPLAQMPFRLRSCFARSPMTPMTSVHTGRLCGASRCRTPP